MPSVIKSQLYTCRKAYQKRLEKKVVCDGGGFLSLQRKLLRTSEVDCSVCAEMLKQHHWSQVDMNEFCHQHSLPVGPVQQLPIADGEAGEAVAEEEAAAQPKPVEGEDDLVMDDADVTDWQEYVSLHPTIELLPAGSFAKNLPYRCTACRTRAWPSGKVNDFCAPKLKIVKHFLKQHLTSLTHIRNMRRAGKPHGDGDVEMDGEKEESVSCQALGSEGIMCLHLYTVLNIFSFSFTKWLGMGRYCPKML